MHSTTAVHHAGFITTKRKVVQKIESDRNGIAVAMETHRVSATARSAPSLTGRDGQRLQSNTENTHTHRHLHVYMTAVV